MRRRRCCFSGQLPAAAYASYLPEPDRCWTAGDPSSLDGHRHIRGLRMAESAPLMVALLGASRLTTNLAIACYAAFAISGVITLLKGHKGWFVAAILVFTPILLYSALTPARRGSLWERGDRGDGRARGRPGRRAHRCRRPAIPRAEGARPFRLWC
jgi:hypothetical protein